MNLLRWPVAPAAAAPPRALQRFRLLAPPGPLSPASGVALLRALHALKTPLSLDLVVTSSLVELALTGPQESADRLARAVHGAVPTWSLDATAPLSAPAGRHRLVSTINHTTPAAWAPIANGASFGAADPIAALIEAVQPLDADDQLLVRLFIEPAAPIRAQDLSRSITRAASPRDLVGVIGVLTGVAPRVARFEPAVQRRLTERLAAPAFQVALVVLLSGSDRTRLTSRSASLAAVFTSQFDAGFGGLQLTPWTDLVHSAGQGRSLKPRYLTVDEVAALWHPPVSQGQLTGLAVQRRPETPLPPAMTAAHGLLLGTHSFRGVPLPVVLPRADLAAGHVTVTGRTGVGKSTLVEQLLSQFSSSAGRPGLALIDPHGDLARDLAARIPAEREDDVVLVELGDPACSVALPLIEATEGVDLATRIDTTFALIRLLFQESWSETRMADAVFALAATLCSMRGATLLDAPGVFHDAAIRRRAQAQLTDQIAREFWADYERLSASAQRELARPVLYRLRSFYRSAPVRRIVCQPTGLDFGRILDEGKILLVSLAGRNIQGAADLLGELVIARLHLAALARLERPAASRRPFALAVDESQRFQGASLPILLAESRKLGMRVILATQFLDAWGETLAASVLGNVGTLIAFRSSPADSRRLAASLRPFGSDTLEDLDRYEAIVKLQIGGETMPAVAMRTLPLDEPRDEARLERIRQQTRLHYGTDDFAPAEMDGMLADEPVAEPAQSSEEVPPTSGSAPWRWHHRSPSGLSGLVEDVDEE